MKQLLPFIALCVVCAQTPAPKPPAAKAPAAQPAAPKPAAQPPAAPADPVVLEVGGEKITRSQYERIVEALPEQARAQATGPQKRRFAEQIAEIKAMVQEARLRKVDQEEKIRTAIALQADTFLASTLYQQLNDSLKPTDAQLRAHYERNRNQYEQVTAKHILIRFQGSRVPLKEGQKDLTDEEALAKANEIRGKLQGGASFEEVARAESDDTGSGAQGGSLGSFGRGQMVPTFEAAAFSLPVGQLSEPVKSPFGYHLILVSDHSSRSFDEVRGEIEKQIKPQLMQEVIEGIRKKALIRIDEVYFGR
jgi:peptidyl-prolyl cis-trans isomerase C